MSEVAVSKSFEDRMFEKIRDQFGELMTDDDLRKLVDKAMQKAFFEPRVNADRGYGSTSTLPPLFITMLEKQMGSVVSAAVSKWVEDHPEEVLKALKETLEAGIFQMMLNHFQSKTTFPISQLFNTLQSKGIL